MSLLNSASLVVTPNGYKEGTLYSVIPNTTLGDMTVVRATTATRVNSAGLIELVPYNLLERSQEFDNATYWGVSEATISANATVAPDGTNTADKLIESNTNALHEVYTNVPLSLTAGSAYTKTVYAKSAERTQISLNFVTGGFGQGASVIANLSNGTLGTVNNVGGVTGSTATITNAGNGWYRISITMTPASTANFYADFSPALSGNISYLGNGTSGIYIWGAQLVEGTLPKDYLRTETRLNIPRLDYSNGSCPSLLVEPQRTNSLRYSEDFTNIAWDKYGVTISSNSISSPSGIQNADKIVSVNGASTCGIGQFNNISTGTNYTYSTYLKKGEVTWIQLIIVNITIFRVWVNLDNGTIGTNGFSSATLDDVGNGWFKFSAVFNSLGVATTNYITLANGDNIDSFTGNGTSGVYAWGTQLEAGSYPTSYIPTTSAAVTRNADEIYKTGISSLIGQTEGTMFCDVESFFEDSTFLLQIDDSTGNNRIIFGTTSGTQAEYYVITGGAVQANAAGGTLPNKGHIKVALAYKNNDFAFYANGQQINLDTLGSVPTMSVLRLGENSVGAGNKGAKYNAISLFPTRLTNAELASLTTI